MPTQCAVSQSIWITASKPHFQTCEEISAIVLSQISAELDTKVQSLQIFNVVISFPSIARDWNRRRRG
jgi:hypothetical protein